MLVLVNDWTPEPMAENPIRQAAAELKTMHPGLFEITCVDGLLRQLERSLFYPIDAAHQLGLDPPPYSDLPRRVLRPVATFMGEYGYSVQQVPIIGELFSKASVSRLNRKCSLLDYVWLLRSNCDFFLEQSSKYRNSKETKIASREEYDSQENYLEEKDAYENFVKLAATLAKHTIKRALDIVQVKYGPLRATRVALAKPDTSLSSRLDQVERLRAQLSVWPDNFDRKLSNALSAFLDTNSGYQELLVAAKSDQCIDGKPLRDLLVNVPLAARKQEDHFPRYSQMCRVSTAIQFPVEYMHIHAVVYAYQEARIRRGTAPQSNWRQHRFAKYDVLQRDYDHLHNSDEFRSLSINYM